MSDSKILNEYNKLLIENTRLKEELLKQGLLIKKAIKFLKIDNKANNKAQGEANERIQ